MSQKNRVAFYTLGCKLNYSESSTLGFDLLKNGFEIVNFDDQPDFFIINTCSVTDFADRKNRKIIRKAKKINPNSKVIVIGCYAQLKPDEIAAIPDVDLILGANDKFQIKKHLRSEQGDKVISCQIEDVEEFHYSFSHGERTRSFLKVQTGCDYSCTFCTIPMARGKSRSGDPDVIFENAKEIASLGIKEIVLTGVNIGDYGKNQEGKNLLYLLRRLDEIKGIERIRISSIEPNLISDDIISFVSDSRAIMPHFHIPLQSGSDKILREMKRRYMKDLYSSRIEKIKSLLPHACIGVDVIVGFPGESESDFRQTYDFIEGLDISYLHIFTYSERSGTPAYSMPDKVPVNIRRMRNEILTKLSDNKKKLFYSKFLNSISKVLVEKPETKGEYSGFTENYLKVNFKSSLDVENEIVNIFLSEIDDKLEIEGKFLNIWEANN